MSVMEVRGFRCQRTIQQLMLESFPQIILQCYMLYKIKVLQVGYFDLGTYDIEMSLLTALLHLLLECINLSIEASVSETPFKNYIVSCYNARQEWFPQQEDLIQLHDDSLKPVKSTNRDSFERVSRTSGSLLD